MLFIFAANQVNHKAHAPYVWIVGSLGIVLAVIILFLVVYVSLRSSNCCTEGVRSQSKDSEVKISPKFHILRKPSFCCASGRYMGSKSGDWNPTNGESSSHQITISKGCTTKTMPIYFIISPWRSRCLTSPFFPSFFPLFSPQLLVQMYLTWKSLWFLHTKKFLHQLMGF